MKGHDVFKPWPKMKEAERSESDECNTNLYKVLEEYRMKNEVPEWVNHIRTDDDGKELGFELEPTKKLGKWQGGGKWIVLT
jgi:hypothetical protein